MRSATPGWLHPRADLPDRGDGSRRGFVLRILSAAYPGEVTLAPIVTAYIGVAMNGLPANIGTFVTLFLFVAIIPSCRFPGALAAYLVQKIFFTIAGTFVYLYLFLSVPGRSTRTWATSRITPCLRSPSLREAHSLSCSAASSGAR